MAWGTTFSLAGAKLFMTDLVHGPYMVGFMEDPFQAKLQLQAMPPSFRLELLDKGLLLGEAFLLPDVQLAY